MDCWTENKNLVKAYEKTFESAYGADNFNGFVKEMEIGMEDSVAEHCDDRMLHKDAWNEEFEMTMENILEDAQDHYRELQSKYSAMQ